MAAGLKVYIGTSRAAGYATGAHSRVDRCFERTDYDGHEYRNRYRIAAMSRCGASKNEVAIVITSSSVGGEDMPTKEVLKILSRSLEAGWISNF